MNGIICPNCHAALDIEGEGMNSCSSCGQPYEIKNGIVDFTPENHFYWGEISQEAMKQVNKKASADGWFNALLDHVVHSSRKDLLGYILNDTRVAGMFHYYDPAMNDSCLDLGSGWGPISFGLSRFYKTVYSIDGVAERLEFQAIRARQEHVTNLKLIRSSMLKLPFENDSISVVIVNGLLEWIGLSDEKTDPRKLQEIFLEEVRRVLKPGGKIFIGIENRFGAQFLMGETDHSGLRYTSLMPRWLASQVVKFSRTKQLDAEFFSGAETSYRTPTYTYWGYQKLLRQGGFCAPSFYWAWSSYNNPQVSGTLDAESFRLYLGTVESQLTGWIKPALVRVLELLPDPLLGMLLKTFSPHFLIVASKEKSKDGLQEEILRSYSSDKFLRTSLEANAQIKSSYTVVEDHGMKRIVDVTSAGKNGTTSFIMSEEQSVRGRPVRLYSQKEIKQVAVWLADYQAAHNRGWWPVSAIRDEINRLVKSVKTKIEDEHFGKRLDDFAAAYLAAVQRNPLPVVPEHGDFTPANILISKDFSIDPINWIEGEQAGNPLMDAGAFILSLLLREKTADGIPASAAESPQIREFTNEYARRTDYPLPFAPGYYVLRAFDRDIGNDPINARNYLKFYQWTGLLESSLDYGLRLISTERLIPAVEL